MATITIRNVPDHVVQRLKEQAARHGRSLNSELVLFLERSVKDTSAGPEQRIADLRAFRASLSMPETTADEIEIAKEYGRR